MRCDQIMRRPVHLCRALESVEAVAGMMRDANIGFLPVCDEDFKTVVGVVTDRDLATRVLAERLDPKRTRVGDVMTREVLHCRPEDDVLQAQALMSRYRRSRIVVVGAKNDVVGIVSLSDVASLDSPSAVEVLKSVAAREMLDVRGNVAGRTKSDTRLARDPR